MDGGNLDVLGVCSIQRLQGILDGCKINILEWRIERRVYIEQLEGFRLRDDPNIVYKLKKVLYGLKQAPRAWYGRLDKYLTDQGFQNGSVDNNLYFKTNSCKTLIVIAYVDDMIFGGNEGMCRRFANEMHNEIEMSMIGELNFFLGLQINQSDRGIFISQSKYIKELLKKFGLENSKPVCTPMTTRCKLTKEDKSPKVDASQYRSTIGGLSYLIATRPDIIYVVCLATKFQQELRESHVVVVKRIFKYLKGTTEFGLWYLRSLDFTLTTYIDADWAESVDDQKSTSG